MRYNVQKIKTSIKDWHAIPETKTGWSTRKANRRRRSAHLWFSIWCGFRSSRKRGTSPKPFSQLPRKQRCINKLLQSITQRFKRLSRKAFRHSYPYINGIYNAAIFAYQIAYIYGKTAYYSPWLHFCRVAILRISDKDLVRLDSCQRSLDSAPLIYPSRHNSKNTTSYENQQWHYKRLPSDQHRE